MKTKPKLKTVIIIALSSLIFISAIGATIAYITDKTPPLENEFTPVAVSCEILENFDGATKKDVAVRNTGDVNAYVRAVIMVSWISEENGSMYPAMPTAGVDYVITQDSAKWVMGTDGYYYYISPLRPGENTEFLISSLSGTDTTPQGYKLSVNIAASAFQTDPKEPVENLWGIKILDNGNILVD